MIARTGGMTLLKLLVIYAFAVYALVLLIWNEYGSQHSLPSAAHEASTRALQPMQFSYNRLSPLIFIGGAPGSGTKLMQALLDAYAGVQCGNETQILRAFLNATIKWVPNEQNATSREKQQRIIESGLNADIILSACAAYILRVLSRRGPPALRLCNSNPDMLKWAVNLSRIFPNARFLFMVRDGRAVTQSFENDYQSALNNWNNMVKEMNDQCDIVGPLKCHKVYYEQLVWHPEQSLRSILMFLNITRNNDVLCQTVITKTGMKITKTAKRQMKMKELFNWNSSIPVDVQRNMNEIAPMLSVLGYNCSQLITNYERNKLK